MCEEFTYIKKVAINTKKGGRFELSQQAMAWLAKKAPTVGRVIPYIVLIQLLLNAFLRLVRRLLQPTLLLVV